MKFLFLVNDLSVGGGIASSLLNISNTLAKEGHDVDFLNFTREISLHKEFDNKIKLLELNDMAKLFCLQINEVRKAKGVKKIKLAFYALIKKLTHKTSLWQKFCFSKTFYSGYDVAVAFRQSPLNFWFVNNRTDAKVKIGFWHGDPDYMTGIDKWSYTIKYLDYLACVSNAVKDKMKLRYPKFSDKFVTVYNIFNAQKIIKKAQEFNSGYDKNTFNIVTVARIDFEQKQLDFIPTICSGLKSKGYNFKWHIVGDGGDREKLISLINEKDVKNCVILYGNQENPYPYIKQADLFCLTSIWESYGMVLTESLILGTPCVVGKFPAAYEVANDGINGLIVDNSVKGIESGVQKLLDDKNLYLELKQNAINFKYDYKKTYNMFMEICKNDKV